MNVFFISGLLLIIETQTIFACSCLMRDTQSKVCENPFAGLIEVTGVDRSSCRLDYTCRSMKVVQSWKPDDSPDLLVTHENQGVCGLDDGLPSSGLFIASGAFWFLRNRTLHLSTCSFILQPVTSVNDPLVTEYQQMLKNCHSNNRTVRFIH